MRRAKQIARRVFLGLVLLAVVPIVIAVVARYSDGPIFVFPSGALVAGTPIDYKSLDWNRVDHIRELEFQLESPSRSRITRFVIHENAPYIPCGFCTNHLLKRWPRELELDDRVVLRVDGMLIAGRAVRVPNESAEYTAARAAHSMKFSPDAGTRSAAEGAAARFVVGAARLAGGHDEESEPDSWLYRIDPR